MTPKGTKQNPIVRKVRPIAKTNPSLHIGIPWEIAAMAKIKQGDEYRIYIDFPDENKIVMERIASSTNTE